MVQFENTEIAFDDKSRFYLIKVRLIFSIISKKWIVKTGESLLKFAIKIRFPISWAIKHSIFKQFCGGETLDECNASIKKLATSHIKSILDYSAEGLDSEKNFDDVSNTIKAIIKKASLENDISHAVFKPTGIGRIKTFEKAGLSEKLSEEDALEYARIKARFFEICSYAAEKDVPIMVDAEESWIQVAIDSLTEEAMQKLNISKPIVYNTIQLYRKERLNYLTEYSKKAWDKEFYPAFKLVRGAYHEKEQKRSKELGYESPVHIFKKDTDSDFDYAIKFCLDNIDKLAVCIGTHNESSVQYAISYMDLKGIYPYNENVCFSQLYGMSDNISYNLAAGNYNVTKYVPYGPIKLVLPYLIRRAEENTSISGQTGRELELIKKELKRRRRK